MATLTVSGNEITDALRALNVQGDGRAADSSFGIWEAATNPCTNGGFETNLTGWSTVGAATFTRDNGQSKFGSWSLKGVCASSADTHEDISITGLVASTTYAISAWVNCTAFTAGAFSNRALAAFDAADVATFQTSTLTAATAGWVRHTIFVTTTAAVGAHTINIRLYCPFGTIYWDGVQVEAKSIATPYVHTDGGAATRNAARVQAPTSLLSATQGWVAVRLRMGYASASRTGAAPVFECAVDANNYLAAFLHPALNGLRVQRFKAGAGTNLTNTTVGAWAQGDTITVIFAWTATALRSSVNGTPFQSAADANIPALPALFDIGTDAVGALGFIAAVDSDVLWTACGTGTLTDADAATINGFGNTDKAPEDFNAATASRAVCTAAMPFSTTLYMDEAFTIIDPKGDGTSRGLFPRLRVDIDFTNEPTNATRVWTNVTADVRDLKYQRAGRSNEYQRTEPGTIGGTLNNRHGKYDRTNTSGPYYPNVKRNRWIRVRARWNNIDYTRWTGLVTAWRQKWPGDGFDATVDIEGVDAMTVLRLFDLVGLSYGSQRTDQRVSAVCASAGITATIASNGSSSVDASGTFGQGSDALAHLNQVEEHENGLIFAEGDGTITFQDRHFRILFRSTTSGTIGDQAGEIRYRDAELDDDADIWNSVLVTPVGGAAQSATNTTSTTSYFKRVLTRALLNNSTSEALSAAQYLSQRYGDPSPHVPAVDLLGERDTTTWPTILGIKNSDRYTFKRRATAHTISQDVLVERVGDTWAPDSYMHVGLEMSAADEQQGWVLGDATYSLLGSTTRLIY